MEDLATAHVAAVKHLAGGGESVRCNLGTGIGVSVKEIIDIAEEVTGQKVPVKYGERRPGDPAQLVADPRLAKEILAWEAQHTEVRSMVETAWQWMSAPHGGHFKE